MREELRNALHNRYATKQFDTTKKISESDWKLLKEALRLSPSSYGLQPWVFIEVNTASIREELKPHSWGQSPVTDADKFIVIAVKEEITEEFVDEYLTTMAKERNIDVSTLHGFRDMLLSNIVNNKEIWGQSHFDRNAKQSYIALGFVMLSASLLGIDTLPMEGFNPLEYNNILGLEEKGLKAVAAIACGYRDSDDKYQFAKKVRFPEEKVFLSI